MPETSSILVTLSIIADGGKTAMRSATVFFIPFLTFFPHPSQKFQPKVKLLEILLTTAILILITVATPPQSLCNNHPVNLA